jgi:hypothetical protein
MSLYTDLTVKLVATLAATSTGTGLPQLPVDVTDRYKWSSGTTADKADKMYSATRTLASSTSEDLDMTGGALKDAFGVALAFARVKLIYMQSASGNDDTLVVTEDASAGVPGIFTNADEGVIIRPGGAFLWVAPDATGAVVTATSADLITVTNSSSTDPADYDVVIIGASA